MDIYVSRLTFTNEKLTVLLSPAAHRQFTFDVSYYNYLFFSVVTDSCVPACATHCAESLIRPGLKNCMQSQFSLTFSSATVI